MVRSLINSLKFILSEERLLSAVDEHLQLVGGHAASDWDAWLVGVKLDRLDRCDSTIQVAWDGDAWLPTDCRVQESGLL